MKISIRKSGNKGYADISGSMYVEDALELRERLLGLLDEGVKEIFVDMSGLEYIDSAGLGMLIGINKKCLQRGGRLTVGELKGMVGEIFKLTRMDLVFE